MSDRTYFLLFAEQITGTSRFDIRVIDFSKDKNGLFSGTIEINGNREYIHEYHN
jgi:hypothetical protein